MRVFIVRRTAAQALAWEGGASILEASPAPSQGQAYDYDVAARVTGEQSIALLSGSAPGLSYNPATMRLTGTPTAAGTYDLNFRAYDSSAAADWAARISGPGVVWYHNFDNAAEVNQFLWSSGYGGGNDPNRNGTGAPYVTHQPSESDPD